MKKTMAALSCVLVILFTQPLPALSTQGSLNISGMGQHEKDTVPPQDSLHIYDKVEEEAYFPGREEGWLDYLQQNLKSSIPVDNGAPPGTYTVMVQFVVNTEGRLSAFKPLTKHGFGMEGEVIRILRKSPSWVPAVQAGRKVNAYRKQPVTFMVIDDSKKRRRHNSK